MTNQQAIELRRLIFESELAAQVYGRQSQRIKMMLRNDPAFKENGDRIENSYASEWSIKSKALNTFIDSLVEG